MFLTRKMLIKHKFFFTKTSILLAFAYWFLDSIIHHFLFGELDAGIIPYDANEFVKRFTVFLLVILFGIFADYHTSELIRKDREKFQIYQSMLNASHHIINNFLNQMIIFRLEAERSEDFDEDILELYDQIIDLARKQLKKLENLPDLSQSSIERRLRER